MDARCSRIALVAALALGSLASGGSAQADPVGAQTGVTEGSASTHSLRGADGSTAYAAVLALRSPDGAALRVRLCVQEGSCDDYVAPLQPGEFVMDPVSDTVHIDVMVASLGEVHLRSFVAAKGAWLEVCPDPYARTALVFAGTGPTVAHADAIGGTIGNWTAVRGLCGMIARDVTAAWLSL